MTMIEPEDRLATWAAHSERSRGRRHAEAVPAHRNQFQRDRDRIIHSGAFRRLEYKTQVFVNHEGDLYRTRLTHTLEVAQIGRTIARALGLNEDLVEAIALAHDLGHTPFGHAGQDALHDCMKAYGGFEHNLQSLRIVDELEQRYAEFDGLNLTFETREGILKHCAVSKAPALGELGERFLLRRQPSLEAQIANLADEIAYNNHDIDDGLRAGLLTLEQLGQTELFYDHQQAVLQAYPQLDQRRLGYETIRRMINQLVTDLIETSRQAITAAAPADIEAVRAYPGPLIRFSDAIAARNGELKHFLRHALYQHYHVQRMAMKAKHIVQRLFNTFMENPHLLPPQTVRAGQAGGQAERARSIADYIAGMTDRYAIAEYERLFDPRARMNNSLI